METLHKLIKKRPHLVWSAKNYNQLSEEVIVESILNYGDFEDIKKMISILGVKRVAEIFEKQIEQKRTNYSPKIINYFKLYFKQYAQRDFNKKTNRTSSFG